MENGPPFLPARTRSPAMRLHDRPADRQADAHAVLLGCHEGLEQLRGDDSTMPGARILNADLDEAVVGRRGRDCQRANRTVDHGVDRVADQVDEHLLNLDAVDEDQIGVGIELNLDIDSMLARADQRERIGFRRSGAGRFSIRARSRRGS